MKETREEQILLRVSAKTKIDIVFRCSELKMSKQEYILNLIEKDLTNNASKIPDREKNFIEEKLDEVSTQIVSFLKESLDKKMDKLLEYTEPREVRIEKIITAMSKYFKGAIDGIELKESYLEKWRKELSEAADLYEKAAEFKENIDRVIEDVKSRKQN